MKLVSVLVSAALGALLVGVVSAQTPTIFDDPSPATKSPEPKPPVPAPEAQPPAAPVEPPAPQAEPAAPPVAEAPASTASEVPAPKSPAAQAALAKHQAAVKVADTAFATASAAATTTYLDNLKRAMSLAMNDRKLDAANWCDAEIKRVKSGQPIAVEGGNTPAIKNARQSHAAQIKTATDRQRDALATARRICLSELDAAAKLAMRNKQLDEANAITAVIADLKSNDAPKPALADGEQVVFTGKRATIVEGRPAERDYTLNFKVVGQSIDGTIDFPGYGNYPLSGTLQGSRIEFRVEPPSTKLRQTYTGTINGQELKISFSGVTTDGKQIQGTATGVRQKN